MDRVGVIVIEDKEDIVVRDHETTDLVLWCGGRSLEGIRRRSGVNRDNEYSFENRVLSRQGIKASRGIRMRVSKEEEDKEEVLEGGKVAKRKILIM